MNKRDIELVKRSYMNWADNPNLILTFYDQLLSMAPQLAPMFTHTDMGKHNELLRQVIRTIIEHEEGDAKATLWLEKLKNMHAMDLNIDPKYFKEWRNSMLFAIAAHDKDWDAKVNKAWHHLFDSAEKFMTQ
ncbi:globin [Fulvivirga sediminis]|uniref:Globin n=1 Tax=Fulvivirga sediminis TaxID=2803949 RepID=A0A937F2Q5_9BACT|nr:globin [Fulvivirga sediminis]MBL3655232.1 globin [Fulvivirga sediminis]